MKDNSRKIIIGIISLLLVLSLSVGGFFLWKKYSNNNKQSEEVNITEIDKIEEVQDEQNDTTDDDELVTEKKLGYIHHSSFLGVEEEVFLDSLKEEGFTNIQKIGDAYSNFPKGTISYYSPEGELDLDTKIEYRVSLGVKKTNNKTTQTNSITNKADLNKNNNNNNSNNNNNNSENQKKEHKHEYVSTVVKPTCDEKGYTLHECSCGDTYKDNYVDATGHDFTDNAESCRNGCGEKNPNYIQPNKPADTDNYIYNENVLIDDFEISNKLVVSTIKNLEPGIILLKEENGAYTEAVKLVEKREDGWTYVYPELNEIFKDYKIEMDTKIDYSKAIVYEQELIDEASNVMVDLLRSNLLFNVVTADEVKKFFSIEKEEVDLGIKMIVKFDIIKFIESTGKKLPAGLDTSGAITMDIQFDLEGTSYIKEKSSDIHKINVQLNTNFNFVLELSTSQKAIDGVDEITNAFTKTMVTLFNGEQYQVAKIPFYNDGVFSADIDIYLFLDMDLNIDLTSKYHEENTKTFWIEYNEKTKKATAGLDDSGPKWSYELDVYGKLEIWTGLNIGLNLQAISENVFAATASVKVGPYLDMYGKFNFSVSSEKPAKVIKAMYAETGLKAVVHFKAYRECFFDIDIGPIECSDGENVYFEDDVYDTGKIKIVSYGDKVIEVNYDNETRKVTSYDVSKNEMFDREVDDKEYCLRKNENYDATKSETWEEYEYTWDNITQKCSDETENSGEDNKQETSGSTFKRFDENLTWSESKAVCESEGGYLAVVNSEEENEEILSILEGGLNNYWIGLYKEDSETWKWVNGEEITFLNWDDSEPSKDYDEKYGENFGQIQNADVTSSAKHHRGRWNNASNEGAAYAHDFWKLENFGYVCEYDKEEEHKHEYVEVERVNPTTSKEGYILSKCSICGAEHKEVLAKVNVGLVETTPDYDLYYYTKPFKSITTKTTELLNVQNNYFDSFRTITNFKINDHIQIDICFGFNNAEGHNTLLWYGWNNLWDDAHRSFELGFTKKEDNLYSLFVQIGTYKEYIDVSPAGNDINYVHIDFASDKTSVYYNNKKVAETEVILENYDKEGNLVNPNRISKYMQGNSGYSFRFIRVTSNNDYELIIPSNWGLIHLDKNKKYLDASISDYWSRNETNSYSWLYDSKNYLKYEFKEDISS